MHSSIFQRQVGAGIIWAFFLDEHRQMHSWVFQRQIGFLFSSLWTSLLSFPFSAESQVFLHVTSLSSRPESSFKSSSLPSSLQVFLQVPSLPASLPSRFTLISSFTLPSSLPSSPESSFKSLVFLQASLQDLRLFQASHFLQVSLQVPSLPSSP